MPKKTIKPVKPVKPVKPTSGLDAGLTDSQKAHLERMKKAEE